MFPPDNYDLIKSCMLLGRLFLCLPASNLFFALNSCIDRLLIKKNFSNCKIESKLRHKEDNSRSYIVVTVRCRGHCKMSLKRSVFVE